MAKPLFSKSTRKYIRKEKARIRRESSDTVIRREFIEKLLKGFLPKQKEKLVLPKKKEVKEESKKVVSQKVKISTKPKKK